ncbi:MAG: dipeptidyl aminopeptidase/acylaminoacyl peptidase [Flavobacteriaceae bacterium]|jgi:dipeptidyl aminopeptidase/acylaminoacyl peptidase
MKKIISILLIIFVYSQTMAQKTNMTSESLIKLGRVSVKGISKDSNQIVFGVSKYSFTTQKKTNNLYSVSIDGGELKKITKKETKLIDKSISPNGEYKIKVKNEKLKNVTGTDFHPDVKDSNVLIYDELNYRHWDAWEDGNYSHIMYRSNSEKKGKLIDIMKGEPFHSPQKPFGGDEDYLWSPDSKNILYVTKKASGTAYAISTNTDIFSYELATGKTTNLTEYNKGYDTSPTFSDEGQLAWLQMKRDGYESDKNDIIVRIKGKDINLTKDWDGTVNSFIWANDSEKIYFVAPVLGTVQIFEIAIPTSSESTIKSPRKITNGQFDVHGIIGQVGEKLAVLRRDMNHASEIYSVDITSGSMAQLSSVNDKVYANTNLGKVEKRMTKTTDGKDLLSWVIYPPDFDSSKKYPTLLYCQGGPQGALSQFYSFRWNFQLMAANGYIIIAPNRRGMPGYGVEWNEQISKDYGGQNMDDYLSAIDDISKEDYVDNNRLGCVGASYGGYSAFYLAGKHEGRFKSFISHDGIFDWRSMYGTTEEVFFPNWDLGGAFWDKSNKAAQKAYTEFNPTTYVDQWDTPMLIIQGGKDYRVPIGQGLAAFQAAQLKGIKSKLVFFPEENHWVLNNQNSLVWQREFYKWLKETL